MENNRRKLEKILLVEDEQDIQTIASMALTSIGGFILEVCSSGKEALDRGRAFLPDLILLDVMMPEMDGPATLRALQEIPELKKTPVIFLTAKVQSREVEEYTSMGALGVISKPFDPMTLSENVKNIFAGA